MHVASNHSYRHDPIAVFCGQRPQWLALGQHVHTANFELYELQGQVFSSAAPHWATEYDVGYMGSVVTWGRGGRTAVAHAPQPLLFGTAPYCTHFKSGAALCLGLYNLIGVAQSAHTHYEVPICSWPNGRFGCCLPQPLHPLCVPWCMSLSCICTFCGAFAVLVGCQVDNT